MIAIGIDPGVVTGIAVWDAERYAFIEIMSSGIVSAMRTIDDHGETFGPGQIFVIVEDARKRNVFAKADLEEQGYAKGARMQGVGSIKRDCSIWEEFLRDHGIAYEMRRPIATKMKAPQFQQLTGWTRQTNEHARDAAMIIFQLNRTMLRLKLQTYTQERQRETSDEPTLHSPDDRRVVAYGSRGRKTLRYRSRG